MQVCAGPGAGTERLQEGAPGEGLGEHRGQECRHEGSKWGLARPSGQEGGGRALRPCQVELGAVECGRQKARGSCSSASFTAEAAAQAQPAGDTRPALCYPQGPSCSGARAICDGEMSGQHDLGPKGGDKCAGENAGLGRSSSK